MDPRPGQYVGPRDDKRTVLRLVSDDRRWPEGGPSLPPSPPVRPIFDDRRRTSAPPAPTQWTKYYSALSYKYCFGGSAPMYQSLTYCQEYSSYPSPETR